MRQQTTVNVLLVGLSTWLACGGPDPSSQSQPDSQRVSACRLDCASPCGSDEVCLQSAWPYGGGYDATCVTSCSTTDDCATGFRCAEMWQSTIRVCVSDTVPTRCDLDEAAHCDLFAACRDADTLAAPFADSTGIDLCGVELVHCPNGCEDGDSLGARCM